MVKGKLLEHNRYTFGLQDGFSPKDFKLRMKRDLTSCICVLPPEARRFSGSL